MVATAAWCSRVLTLAPYDLALNLGVCGSFDPALEPGRVVHVVSDRIAELGAEDGEGFWRSNNSACRANTNASIRRRPQTRRSRRFRVFEASP